MRPVAESAREEARKLDLFGQPATLHGPDRKTRGVVKAAFGLRPTVPPVNKTRLRKPNHAATLWRGSTGKNRVGYAAYSEHRDHRPRRSRQDDTRRLPAQAVRNIPRQPGHRDGGAHHGLDGPGAREG